MRAELGRIVVLALLAGTVACAKGNAGPEAPEATAAPAGLDGKWLARGLRGDQGPPSIAFRNGRVEGHAGCNSFGGSYSVAAGGGLAFGPMAASKKLCPGEPMQSESRVFEALARTHRAKLDGNRLELLDAEDDVLLELERAR